MEDGPERELAVLLHADVVASTALVQLTRAEQLSIEKALRPKTDAMVPGIIDPDTSARVAQLKG